MNKPQVLVFQKFYEPGCKAGGPIKSVRGLVENLSDRIDFFIVCVNRDAGQNQPSYDGIETGKWIEREGPCKVLYVNGIKDPAVKKLVLKNHTWSAVYVHSFYRLDFAVLPLVWWRLGSLAAPRFVLGPRGELSIGAGSIKKLRKNIFRFFTKCLNLHKGVRFHASNNAEAKEAARAIGKPIDRTDVGVAADLAPSPPKPLFGQFDGKDSKTLRVIFLSRIAPKKNLLYAISVLQKSKVNIIFDIYGIIDDDAYWQGCKKLAESLPDNIQFKYCGHIDQSRVHETMSNYDLFFLPTLGENFGHVILEGLLGGCYVLLSDQTPWHSVNARGVGKTIALENEQDFIDTIEERSNLINEERDPEVRQKRHSFGLEQINLPHDIDATYEILIENKLNLAKYPST